MLLRSFASNVQRLQRVSSSKEAAPETSSMFNSCFSSKAFLVVYLFVYFIITCQLVLRAQFMVLDLVYSGKDTY